MTRHFCCYLDQNYLSRALAMHASLRRHCGDFRIHVLALSDECEEILTTLDIDEISVTGLPVLEDHYPDLAEARRDRSPVEYIFTLSPVWPRYLLETRGAIDRITYLDSDLWFFSDPDQVFNEIGSKSIAIVSHRFTPALRAREKYGKYNVGWLTFRRDENGMACLQWWMDRCLEWCFDRVDGGRFADQGYLNDWPERFDGVCVIEHPGANLAPWNVVADKLDNMHGAAGPLAVEGRPLVFFHFQGMRAVFWRLHDARLRDYQVSPNACLRDAVYAPYIAEVHAIGEDLKRRFPEIYAPKRIGRTGRQTFRRFLHALVSRDLHFAGNGLIL